MDELTNRSKGAPSRLVEILFTQRTTIALISCVLLAAIAALPNLGVIIGSTSDCRSSSTASSTPWV